MRNEKNLLGFGCMRFPVLEANNLKSIDMEQLCNMVDHFLENGFTYFDTAYPYHQGCSEGALKKALVDRYPRNVYTVTDKMPQWLITCYEDYEKIFREQLERTGLTYFDYYWLHNLGRDHYPSAEKYGGFRFLQELKKSGRASHIGFSYHDTADLLDEILTKHPEVDYVQLQINYVDWESEVIQSHRCYEVCVKHRKPVIVMEPVKGGGLVNLPEEAEALMKECHPDWSNASWAIRYAASLENVVMVLSGMSDRGQLEDNVSYMKDFRPLNEEEREVIRKVTEIYKGTVAIPCTGCRYCTDGCPKNIDIPTYFNLYNYHKTMRALYKRATIGRGMASECVGCKSCESHCPQHLPVTKYLKDVAEAFEE